MENKMANVTHMTAYAGKGLSKKFKFTLSVEKFKEEANMRVDGDFIYDAELISEHKYLVSWGNLGESTTYSKEDARENIDGGWWIAVE